MSKRLRVGHGQSWPTDAVTQTFVVFGKRGSGKSNTGVVLAEEMHGAGAQIIVLDPIGAWWGLKSSFDGTGTGIPVYVFGGRHSDLPLRATEGELMAQVAIDHRIPMILDMKGWTGADRARFVTAFAEWMLDHNDRVPVHVFLEEADAFIPQHPYKGEERMLGSMDRLIRWGRQEGIGATAITQRSAKVNKDVTTQAEVLIAHRTIGPQDVDAIKQWIKYHAEGDEVQRILSTLPSLPDGTAWVWSPDWLDLLAQVAFRRRETFDSAATPKLGEKRITPKALAEVDVERLRGRLADTIEKAKADDPQELRRRIAVLERAAAVKPAPATPVVERIEVPVLTDADRELIRMTAAEVTAAFTRASDAVAEWGRGVTATLEPLRKATEGRVSESPTPRPVPAPVRSAPAAGPAIPAPAATNGEAKPLTGYGRRLLDTLAARHPLTLTRAQLGILSRSSRKSSSFDAAAAEIRRLGLAELGADGTYRLTDAGWAELGGSPPAPQSPDELRAAWLGALPTAEAALLRTLIDAYPQPMTRAELGEAAGYSTNSSTFQAAVPSLKKAGLADDLGGSIRAAEVLFR